MDQRSRLKEHRDIAIALRERDPAKARLAMQQHFRCLIESMLTATEELAIREVRQRMKKSRERYLLKGFQVAATIAGN